MKKLAVLGVLLSILCAWPTAVKAEGIQAGDQLASGYLGFGVPLQESGIKDPYGTELDWGDVSASYGASYLFFPSEYFGVGAEISGNNFTEAEYDVYMPGQHGTLKSSMNVYNFMFAFRANVNPQSRVRFYIPFGAGLTSAKGKVKGEGYFNDDVSATTSSFGYFIGAGVEADLGESNWMLGGEVRYSGFKFDTNKYFDDGDGFGKKNYSYLSFLVKVGYKF